MPTIQSTKANISYTVKGDLEEDLSSTVPLLAAACSSEFALRFSNNLTVPVTSIDLRGFGGSTFEEDVDEDSIRNATLPDYMSDFNNVITSAFGSDEEETSPKKVALYGYSHAGYFATAFALANPEKVAALILLEPALFTERDELLQRAEAAERGDSRQSLGAMIRYVDPKTGLNAESAELKAQGILDNLQSHLTLAVEFRIRAEYPIDEQDLSKLKMPVLLIGGTESHVNYSVKRAAAAMPDASVWWISGANHFTLESNYMEEISTIVNEFILRRGLTQI